MKEFASISVQKIPFFFLFFFSFISRFFIFIFEITRYYARTSLLIFHFEWVKS